MVRTLLTGATGTLGTALRPRLTAAGHDLRAASRSPLAADSDGEAGVEWHAVDLADSTGLEAAVEGVDVVVHAATAPQGDTEAVDVEGTERLLAAADDAGVSNVVYPSIVGVDDIPYSYYECKRRAEEAVEASSVPGTILRATQFHAFVDEMLGLVSWLPVWPLPTDVRLQPVDVGTVADALVAHATPDASGRVPPVGGPAVLTVGEIARAYRSARGKRRPIVRFPLPGAVARGFRAGYATCPERAEGTETWAEWLAEQYGRGSGGPSDASAPAT